MMPCLLIAMTAVSLGQGTPSTHKPISDVTAIVTDAPGAVIAHAEVTFKGEVTVTMRTADDGSVHLKLPYGRYEVMVASPGFMTLKVVGFLVDTPKPAAFRATLQINQQIIEDGLGDPGSALVPTITSDLPELVKERQIASASQVIYSHSFIACPGDKPCTRTEGFRVKHVPEGCCALIVANGDGRGTDEVRQYEVSLNGERVLLGNSRNTKAKVKLLSNNKLKVVLVGAPFSKIFIRIAYESLSSQ